MKILVEDTPSRPLRESEMQFQIGLSKFGLTEVAGYLLYSAVLIMVHNLSKCVCVCLRACVRACMRACVYR